MRAILYSEFDSFVKEYKKFVVTVCYSFVGNYFTAEDMSQETFISAYKNFAAFDGKSPKGWLVKIAANKCRDYLKKNSTKMETSSSEFLDALANSQENDPEEKFLNKEVKERFRRLINSLNAPYRKTLRMFLIEGFSPGEIAKIQNIPQKTIETQCYRGKKLLKEKWKEEFDNE